MARDEQFKKVFFKSPIILLNVRVLAPDDSLIVTQAINCYRSGGILTSKHQQREGDLHKNLESWLSY